MSSPLETAYASYLDLTYSCVDRIYLRGYVPILQTCGGFRTWAESLRPDEPVSQSWLQSLVRRFHQNVQTYAQENNIPIVQPARGTRRHRLAESYRQKFAGQEGVYLILKASEKAKTYRSETPRKPPRSNHRNLWKREAFVTHFTFYLVDRNWGPLAIVISSHPPFNVKAFLNGHHWVEHELARVRCGVEIRDNAFLGSESSEQLQACSNRISSTEIRRVVDRWTYRLLPILTYEERHRSRFRYEWSMAQLEVSHNLVFRESFPVNELFQRHIDLNRRFISPQSIATAFGKKHPGRPRDRIEIIKNYRSTTTLKIKHNRDVLKQYDKFSRILRSECVCNNPLRFGVRKSLSNFSDLRDTMTEILQRFLALQHAVASSTLPRGELAALAQTSELGKARVPGIRLDNERLMTVLRLLGASAHRPRGVAPRDLRKSYLETTGKDYSSAQACYDLRKLRAKGLLIKIPGSRGYVFSEKGARTATLLYKIHDLLLGPALARAAHSCHDSNASRPRGPVSSSPKNLLALLQKHGAHVPEVAEILGRSRGTIYHWIQRQNINLDAIRKPIPSSNTEPALQALDGALTQLTRALDIRIAA